MKDIGLVSTLFIFFLASTGYAVEPQSNQCQKFADTLQGKPLPMTLTGGVCVVAKPRPISVTMNGVTTKSPLVNTALFSYENGLNLGETATLPSEMESFRDNLNKKGLKITAIHTHWLGTDVSGKPTVLMYIHWMDTKMDPMSFAKATNDAWNSSFSNSANKNKTMENGNKNNMMPENHSDMMPENHPDMMPENHPEDNHPPTNDGMY